MTKLLFFSSIGIFAKKSGITVFSSLYYSVISYVALSHTELRKVKIFILEVLATQNCLIFFAWKIAAETAAQRVN